MKYLLLALLLVGLTGCGDSKITETRHLQHSGIAEIDKDVYIKAIKVYRTSYDYHVVYVYCDKDGNILRNTPISTSYRKDKHTTTTTTM